MKCQSGHTELLSHQEATRVTQYFNPLNAELNPICHLLALLAAHHILHVSRIRVNFVAVQYYLMYIFLSEFWVPKTCPFRLRNVYERANSLDF